MSGLYANTGITNNAQQIVNARLMSEIGVQFNIGADILGKGNRSIEKYLGAEKMSGDTVMVPVVDSGKVFHSLDLSGEDLSVARDAVPVSVGPLSTAAVLDQETLTLSMKDPAVMARRVAKLALDASEQAYNCLAGSALSAQVIATTEITTGLGFAARNKIYDAFALSEGSKLEGDTFGVIHPMVWSKLCAAFQTNYSPNDKVGGDLYKNELGELAGIKWTKSNFLKTITGAAINETIALDYTAAFTGVDAQAPNAVPSYGQPVMTISNVDNFFDTKEVGALSLPFTLTLNSEKVQTTDIFGNPTGKEATFRLVALTVSGGVVTAAKFAGPVFFEGPRQNVYHSDYGATPHTLAAATATEVLTAGTKYLAPAVVWKKDDFLVAVKGLEKFFGMDSLTIPTAYRDRGILPLRGLAWTDPVKAATIFRVDVLLGMSAFLGVSMNSIYIQA
jgi:hypothetical protein